MLHEVLQVIKKEGAARFGTDAEGLTKFRIPFKTSMTDRGKIANANSTVFLDR